MRMKQAAMLSFLITAILALSTTPLVEASSERSKTSSGRAVADWTTAVNISNTGMDSFWPQVGVDKNGKAYVVWSDWTDVPRLVYSNTNVSGQWGSTLRVHTVEANSVEAVFAEMKTTPEGVCHLIFHDVVQSYDVLYFQFKDGTWRGPENVSETEEGGSVYSTLALSPTDGYLYAIWMDEAVNMWDLLFSSRDPNIAAGWDHFTVLPLLAGMQYMPTAAVDGNGTLHLAFITRDGENSTVWYAKNTQPRNHGNWTRPIVIAPNVGIEWSYPKIACDNRGDAYVVWNGRNAQGIRDVFLRKTVNGVWQSIENVSNSNNPSETAAIAANPSSGEFYVSYAEFSGGSWEVFLRAFDRARTQDELKWSNPVNVTNNPSKSGFGHMAVADNGDLHLAYADDRSGRMEIYYTIKYKILVWSPVNVTLKTNYNRVLFYNEKINTITFDKNPDNDEALVASYRVYRKLASESNDKFQLLATLTPSTFKYDDRQLPHGTKYAYTVTTVDVDDNESRITEVVAEN